MDGRKRKGRKLLVATLGVAAVSYVGCSDNGGPDVVANLVAPMDSGADVPPDRGSPLDVVANLVPPPDDATRE